MSKKYWKKKSSKHRLGLQLKIIFFSIWSFSLWNVQKCGQEWNLQISSFVQPTVWNSNTFHIQKWQSSISLHHGSWNLQKYFSIFFFYSIVIGGNLFSLDHLID